MTFNEFKAWLEGYEVSFAFQHSPNAAQWEVIKEKLATVVSEKEACTYCRNYTNVRWTPSYPIASPYYSPNTAGLEIT